MDDPVPSALNVPVSAPEEPAGDIPASGADLPEPKSSIPESQEWGMPPPEMPAAGPLPVKEEPMPPPLSPGTSVDVPPPAPEGETLVIPPAGAGANPFIPQGGSGEEPGVVKPAAPGSPMFKRIIMVLLFLIIIVGIIFGVRTIMGMVGASHEVTISYWGLWEDGPTIQAAITEFQTAHPRIKVQYIKQSPRQYRERLQAAIARGDGPDVFQFHNTWTPMFRNELLPAPATLMSTAEFSSTFYPVASADLVGGQSIYGLPMMFDGLGLYYNESLLAAASVVPPTTWPELLDIVPKLTIKTDTQITQSAISLGTTGNVENFSDIVGLMMMQNGARPANPTGKEAEDTLLFYRKFSNPSDPVYTWNETMDNSIYAFAIGKVAMILAPSWRAFDVKQISPNLRFKIAPVPQLPGNTVNWASYWAGGVSAKSKYQEQAWEFLKYMTGRDTASKLYGEEAKTRLFGEPYARTDLASTLTADPYVGAYIQGAPTAKSFPLASRTFDNGINDKLIKYLEDAINAVGQGTAPTAALQTAAAGFSQVLTSYGLSTGAAPVTAQ